MNMEEKEDTTIYNVVVNHEEQYSIWPIDRENPLGWRNAGESGSRAECLAYIKEVWTDMRPLSLIKKMEEMEKKRPELEREETRRKEEAKNKPKDPRDDLVKYLSEGEHPVEASLRPEKNVQALKECIDRGYVHVKFTNTRGGTELGVRLDNNVTNLSKADFDNNTGAVHLVGGLTLNYVKVRCITYIHLETLTGKGHLEPVRA